MGGRGRKAETKMENGSRGKGKKKGERGGGAMGESEYDEEETKDREEG